MTAAPDATAASADLEFVRNVVERTDRRIDPHAFHFLHWGALVLVWYPLSNFFAAQGRLDLAAWVGGVALALGIVLSTGREIALGGRPRIEGENTFISRQVMIITFACVGGGMILSGLAPAFGFIDGPHVPTLWGLVYATLATMVGVVYRREFLYSGAVIFLGSLLAIVLPDYNGYILGPVMGLGMIVPALMAERRVRAMRREASGD